MQPTDPITMTLPLPPRLTNSDKGRSRHWRALHREKLSYWSELDMRRYTRLIPRAPETPLRYAYIRVTMHLHNWMDDGNAMARMKWVEDWLVKSGYLVNDSRKHLRYEGLPEQRINRREPRIELTLTPVAWWPEQP